MNAQTVDYPTPADIVEAEGQIRVDVHLETRDRWNTVASLSDLTRKVAHEYEDRFLIELIQNAYDAHEPGSTGGRVRVLLDDREGDHGTLYVANTGRPFSRENFTALSNIAKSSKPPGQGIGNKGLGFRSVLQVSDWPEVYSCDPSAPDGDSNFNGFCFGFARDDDILRLTKNELEFQIVEREISRYLLPVRAVPRGDHLRKLRDGGAVTVVRLPLKSDGALAVAKHQIQRVLSSQAPVLLFLSRLSRLDIELIDVEGSVTPHELTRDDRPIDLADMPDQIAVSKVETASRRYLTATRNITEDQVRQVIIESVEAKQLDPAWVGWTGDAEVSLALPLGLDDSHDHAFHLYTFLPMDAASPLGAHLNAPFYTKLARVDLNESVRLNGYLLDAAAELSVDLIRLLVQSEGTAIRESAGVTVDLLTWDAPHQQRLQAALSQQGMDIRQSRLVPGRDKHEEPWVCLDDAYVWRDQGYVEVTRDQLSDVGVALVDLTIGERRIARLVALHQTLQGIGMEPSDDVAAEWFEVVASALAEQAAGSERWNAFYADMANCFKPPRNAQVLQRKKILLDQDGKLRRAGPWDVVEGSTKDPTVFFPPRRSTDAADDLEDDVVEDEEELRVPRSLRRAVSYLNEGVTLRRVEAGRIRRTPVMDLLEEGKLVERFNRHALLAHIRRVLRGQVGIGTQADALRWVYLQFRSSRAGLRGLEQLGLRVPTTGGWVQANQAFFPGSWPSPYGKQLERLANDDGLDSPSLRSLRGRLLLAPSDWPFVVSDPEGWREFLLVVGVREGLWPTPAIGPAVEQDGLRFSAVDISSRFALGDAVATPWIEHVEESWGGYSDLAHPYTPYSGSSELWCLPGQDAFDSMNPSQRYLMAALIIACIGSWPDAAFEYSFERKQSRHRSRPDRQVWPSPAATFLERAAWFPMADPGSRDAPYGVLLGRGWHFDDNDRERAPRFARLCPLEQRRQIEADRRNRQRLQTHGLRVWNDPTFGAQRLTELAELLELRLVGATEVGSFRRACEGAWSDALHQRGEIDIESLPLVVAVGRDLTVIRPGEPGSEAVIHLTDAPVGLLQHLVEAAGIHVLVSDPEDSDELARWLGERDDLTVRRMSDLTVAVIADGQVLEPGPTSGELALDRLGSWVANTVALAVALQPNAVPRVTERVLHQALGRLRRVRAVFAKEVAVEVDGHEVSLGSAFTRSIYIDDEVHPLLVARADRDTVGWNDLESMAESVTALIGHASAVQTLRAGALALGRELSWVWREPNESELAAAFRVSAGRVSEITAGLRAEVEQLKFTLLPAVLCLAGSGSARQLEGATPANRDDLLSLLEQLLEPHLATRLMAVCEQAPNPDTLRRHFEIPLADFNVALGELGRRPIHFPEEHQAEFRGFVAASRSQILEIIRRHFWEAFLAKADLADYAELRSLPGLAPDPAWLDSMEIPDRMAMQARVTAWLAERNVLTVAAPELEPVEAVRELNERFLDEWLPIARAVVFAWCLKRGESPPEAWSSTIHVREAFQTSGCLDFVALTTADLPAWSHALGMWPDMEPSLDLVRLGLTDEDVHRAETEVSRSKERRARTKAAIPLDGTEYNVDEEDLRHLVVAARRSVTPEFLSSSRRVTPLDQIPRLESGASERDSHLSRGGKFRPGRSTPSDEQKAAIGLVGEVLAYEWLRSKYEETTPDSWVSGNRSHGVGGYEGNDSMGYDFEIVQRSQTLYFEVKATSGEDLEFPMGVSELRAARRARKGAYRIIFIQNALYKADRRLMVLPNPLEPDREGQYHQANEGARFGFKPRSRG